MTSPSPSASRAPRVDDLALLDVAVAAARAAATVVRTRAGDVATLRWEQKRHSDFVSEVDLAAEERIREIVLRHVPQASVAGEELSPDAARGAGLVFVADPLDGTTNFLHGYPAFAVSIGVLCEGRLAAGVVVNAVTGEEWTAVDGGGAWRDGTPLRVSSIAEPERALVGTGFPFKHLHLLDAYQHQFAAVLRATSGIRRAGSAALDLCDVAAGRFDAFWELALAPWDVAAGLLLVREAGGVVTDLAGQPARVEHGGLIAGNPTLHRWLLETVTRATPAA